MLVKDRILLVDDEVQLLSSWRLLLEHEGYVVVTAAGGPEAISALQEEVFSLVLLDLNMPGMNGHQVMEFINQQQINVSTIVVSGETAFEWVSKAFLLGAYDYLQKPFEYGALLNTMRNALEKRRLENRFVQLRRKLEQSEKLHRFMIESSPDMIFIVDRDGNFAFVNERVNQLLGYRKEDLIGQHFSTIVVPQCLEKARYWFSRQPDDEGADKDGEIWLQCNPGQGDPHKAQERVAAELNAIGVHEQDEPGEDDLNSALEDFNGTYVVGRDITQRLASEKLIHYQAYHDLLTGLPNRALFLDRLHVAINKSRREDKRLAIMFLDLDRFKIVNDSLGHALGDSLLQGVGRRLKSCLRESDTLARIGGDEFVVMLPDVTTKETAHTVADKIVSVIKEPFLLEGNEIFVTTSIGIAMFPEDGDSAETLIKNSDIAMYHTKDQGKDGYNQYSGYMSVKQHKLLSIENDIRRGIRENQFEVFYQPQVDIQKQDITGVEALLRWNHPEKGLLMPSFFLTVAEESGLIVELGDWVMDTSLAEVKRWRDAGIGVDKLGINFSPKQIEREDFVEKVVAALQRHGFPGQALEIEITESTLMNDVDSTIDKLRQLHEVGVNVAIDDFGTGYSSLSLLQKLPINRLKIDKSFIQDLTEESDRSIIEAIAHMARGLNLGMVAEGVEEDFQLHFLRQLNCPVIQGFIYSQGLPAEEARQLLARAHNVDWDSRKRTTQGG